MLHLLLGVIPVVGWIVSVALSLVYTPILFWSLMLIANRNMKWADAIGFVLKELFNGNFTAPVVLGIIAGFICGATRAVLHILQGDIPSAFRLNPLVTASTVIVPAGWFFLRKRKITPVLTIILIVGASIAVVLNWIYLFLQHGMRS